MAVEIALLKAARPDLDPSTEGLLRRIERLEEQAGGEGSARGSCLRHGRPPPRLVEPAARAPTSAGTLRARPVEPEPPSEEESSRQVPVGRAARARRCGGTEHRGGCRTDRTRGPGPADLTWRSLQQVWPAVLDQLAKTAPALAAFFEEARPVGFDAGEAVVEISFPASATFNKRKAEVPEQRERVAEALKTVTGQGLKPTYVLLDGDAPAPEAPAAGNEDEGVDEEELLERLKSEFDAEEVS